MNAFGACPVESGRSVDWTIDWIGTRGNAKGQMSGE